MLLDSLFLVLGLVLILVGANALTDGASAVAKRFGISDLVIGLTVVAFGTSAPELVISIVSAINGSAELAVGNVVGSNLFNTLVIIGVTAMIVPMTISRGIMINEIPLVILSSIVLLVMGNGPLLDGTSEMMITRSSGIVLLLFFAIFMRYTFSQAKNASPDDPAQEEASQKKPMSMLKSVIWVVGGLAALIYGGDRFVAGASGIARGLGVSEAVIGLTIVAAGTSLPELATSIAAALKGKTGIALGNVIGSNIFNIFLVLGASATIRPLAFGDIGNFDLLTLVVASLLFWIFGWFFKTRTITRVEGAIMTAVYIGYVGVLIANAA
ncbi:MAG: calcium/sodium antiporter [Bacteroides sp.]|nr:calcium/sodium antiporter [Bacteroides sp.]MBD5285787.1 calcium/sodium antiporter [Bacteroides sp.]